MYLFMFQQNAVLTLYFSRLKNATVAVIMTLTDLVGMTSLGRIHTLKEATFNLRNSLYVYNRLSVCYEMTLKGS